MKKITLLSLLLMSTVKVAAQDNTKSDYNKWTIEVMVGEAKGIRPYADGYYSSEINKVLGKLEMNSYTVGTRYMVSRIFGFKGNLYYQDLQNLKGNESKPFEMQMFGVSLEGAINASRLFETEKPFGRFGLLLHGGVKVDQMTSKTLENNYNHTEYNGSIILGVTPDFRISKRMAILLDVSFQTSNRQHLNWDGSYSDPNRNLSGQLVATSLGLNYSFGKNEMHGDWAVAVDNNLKKIEDLNKEIEEMKTDTDKDGVPDYIDLEKNSFAGIAVDSKGRNIDTSKTAVSDEAEKQNNANSTAVVNNQSSVETTNSESIKNMINDGYKAVYFDTAKITPNASSTESIGFVRTYLMNNKNATVDIIGHADAVGSKEFNKVLSEGRAQRVKSILVSAGIDYSRLHVIPEGEDNSVDVKSSEARSLVRKVTFKINDNK